MYDGCRRCRYGTCKRVGGVGTSRCVLARPATSRAEDRGLEGCRRYGRDYDGRGQIKTVTYRFRTRLSFRFYERCNEMNVGG